MFNENEEIIRDYVRMLACKPRVNSFYVSELVGALGITEDECYVELNKLVEHGNLYLKFEIRTQPDLHVITTVEDFASIINTEMEYYGDFYYITYDNIFPKYYIDADYRRYVMKNKNTVLSP